jgi:hypothetical protein
MFPSLLPAVNEVLTCASTTATLISVAASTASAARPPISNLPCGATSGRRGTSIVVVETALKKTQKFENADVDGAWRACVYTSKFWRPERREWLEPQVHGGPRPLYPRSAGTSSPRETQSGQRLPSMNFANMAAKPQNEADTALRAVQIDGQVSGSSGD